MLAMKKPAAPVDSPIMCLKPTIRRLTCLCILPDVTLTAATLKTFKSWPPAKCDSLVRGINLNSQTQPQVSRNVAVVQWNYTT